MNWKLRDQWRINGSGIDTEKTIFWNDSSEGVDCILFVFRFPRFEGWMFPTRSFYGQGWNSKDEENENYHQSHSILVQIFLKVNFTRCLQFFFRFSRCKLWSGISPSEEKKNEKQNRFPFHFDEANFSSVDATGSMTFYLSVDDVSMFRRIKRIRYTAPNVRRFLSETAEQYISYRSRESEREGFGVKTREREARMSHEARPPNTLHD